MRNLLFLILFLILAFVIYTLYLAGNFKSIEPFSEAKESKTYTGIYGPEDMDIDEISNLLLISSTDRWAQQAGKPNEMDGIYFMSLDSTHQPVRFTTTYAGQFHPHGISYLNNAGRSQLYVVNHNADGDFIEIFDISHDTLFHLRSISDPLMCCPNDIVAVGNNKFYVTNDHGSRDNFNRLLEDYLRFPWSNVIYYNGSAFSEAHGGFRYANGIDIAPDGKTLYVAETTGQKVDVFHVNIDDGSLDFTYDVRIRSGLDNIFVDQIGQLWIASHPKLLAFVGHSKDQSKLSPSQVFRLTPSNDSNKSLIIREIYLNNGSDISGSSVAVQHDGHIWIGGVFEPKIVQLSL